MAAPDQNSSYPTAGRLAYGVTLASLSGNYPWGGTGLGLVGAVVVQPPSMYTRTRREENNRAGKVIYLGGDLLLGCTLESSADADAWAAVYPSSTTVSSRRVVQWPGSAVTEGEEVAYLNNLAYVPYNPSAPAVVLYKAAPMLAVNARLRFGARTFHGTPVMFMAVEDSSNRYGAMGLAADLATL